MSGPPEEGRATAAACTVASKNYFAHLRVLAKSLRGYHPRLPVFVLLVDTVDGRFEPAAEPFQLITVDELSNLPNPKHVFLKYDIQELNAAVKPYFFELLFRRHGLEKLLYFDPDIWILSPTDPLWELLDRHACLLTPHILEPIEDDRRPAEIDILRAGLHNLGFLGLSDRPSTRAFLHWWQQRLYDGCWMEPDRGFHADQRWVDLAPLLFDGFHILREPEYNVAHWNLHARAPRIRVTPDGATVDGRPLRFFHFSGFDPEDPDQVSKHQDRFRMGQIEHLRPLFERYRDLLLAHGYRAARPWPYAYGLFESGARIPVEARRLYRGLGAAALRFGDPFRTDGEGTFLAWLNESAEAARSPSGPAITRMGYEIYRSRPDVRRAFPDIFGAQRAAFSAWLKGRGAREHGLDGAFFADEPAIARRARGAGIRSIARGYRSAKWWLKRALRRLRKKDGLVRTGVAPPHPRLDGAAPEPPPGPPQPAPSPARAGAFGVNLSGYLTGEFGVAEAGRSLARALDAADVPFVLNNLIAPSHRSEDRTLEGFTDEHPYRFNVVTVNADLAAESYRELGPDYYRHRHNIGLWFWELARFPDAWLPGFDLYDEIWVASRFCQEAIARASPVPVVKVTLPIVVDESRARPDRARFGLDEGVFVFLFAFDYLSILERKNPLGTIEAFRRAFGTRRDVRLVLKSINSRRAPEDAARVGRALEGLAGQVIDEHLTAGDMTALLSTCDAFVSLHRSEGLGLGLATSMYLGKPVIATAYSGNMDFMDVNDSYLVRYRLVELDRDHGPYRRGNEWAEPDLDHAAALMREVFDERDRAARVGRRAAEDIRTRMSAAVCGRAIRARLERLYAR